MVMLQSIIGYVYFIETLFIEKKLPIVETITTIIILKKGSLKMSRFEPQISCTYIPTVV